MEGTTPDGETLVSDPSDPNATVSLVEVTSVVLALPNGGELSNDPDMPWSDDEQSAGALFVRRERPGGGYRIFAEGDVPDGDAHDQVVVSVTTDPVVPEPLPVHLRLLDVADPDGAGNPGNIVSDNLGAPVLPSELLTIPAGKASAAASFTASHKPGDNYRVVASTSKDWLGTVTAYQPSLVGEVRDQADNALPETPDGTQSAHPAQLSKMLTVWRTLHLEIDSMAPPPANTQTGADERNFIEGDILRIEGSKGNARRVYVKPESPPGITGLSDESRDRCSPPARPVGNGRFEAGELRIGRGDGAQSVGVSANGTDFVESDVGFYIHALLRDASDNSLCTTVVVSSPAGFSGNNSLCTDLFASDSEGLVSFDLRLPPQCDWDEVMAAAKGVEIGSVSFEIRSVGPVRNEDDYRLATVTVTAGAKLPFRLVDDDVAAETFPINLSLLQDSDEPKMNVLAGAYIRPRQIVYENKKTAKFMRNIDSIRTGPNTYISSEAEEARSQGKEDAFATSPGYWVAYLQGAFQESEANDDDPLNEPVTYGLARGSRALIFAESLRDNAEFSEGDCSALTPAHEIGHMFGLPDALPVRGVMSYFCDVGNAFFRLEHLRDIRKGVIQ